MPVKTAFSTLACPDWSIQEVARQAGAMGYQGVDLRMLGSDARRHGGLASDPAIIGADAVRQALETAGIEPACLSTSVALHHRHPLPARRALEQAEAAIDMAARMRCPWVRVYGYEIEPDQSRDQGLHRIADRARELAQFAQPRGVGLLLENAGNLSRARDWWTILDLVHEPNLGLSWNQQAAILAGEDPGVSIPMLHGRIRLARLSDMRLEPRREFVLPGDGAMRVRETMHRLLGVGFEGWVVVAWDRLWLPGLQDAGEYLPRALQRLQAWMQELAKAQEAAKPKPKPVAHAAAKA